MPNFTDRLRDQIRRIQQSDAYIDAVRTAKGLSSSQAVTIAKEYPFSAQTVQAALMVCNEDESLTRLLLQRSLLTLPDPLKEG